MDIYQRKSNWKLILGIVGLLILAVTLFYSNYLADKLKVAEDKNKELFISTTAYLVNNQDLETDIGPLYEIQEKFALPTIIEYSNGEVEGFNWGEKNNTDIPFLKKKIAQFLSGDVEPLDYPFGEAKIYIFNSSLVRLIQYYPLVQVLLVGLFIALGYYLFNTARRAEQNRVWAGMAKETAHQLGTPISAIIAWIEHLKEANATAPDQLEVLDELVKDVDRLELIADRFSKIGSAPELAVTNLYDELDEIKTYMQRRAPRRVIFDFPDRNNEVKVKINQHLFSWVMENLIRNSLDAMEAQGEIGAVVYEEGEMICIDLRDTGKGIAANNYKTVFQPGFSTKMRGWGLGLSLAKRIIENYHRGRIYVKSSKINEGTTFTIKLPKV